MNRLWFFPRLNWLHLVMLQPYMPRSKQCLHSQQNYASKYHKSVARVNVVHGPLSSVQQMCIIGRKSFQAFPRKRPSKHDKGRGQAVPLYGMYQNIPFRRKYMWNKYPYNAIITVTALSLCPSGPSSHSKMLVYVRHWEDLELKYIQIPGKFAGN